MPRITEKVRDIVDVRPYTTVEDLFREPETTLSNYHFTDITAYMMARWFDAVVSGDPSQMCRAIAGFRGVGKSHFLAAFAVLMSHPELRSRLGDQHVQSAVQRLLRRHYPVINVRRGSGVDLLDEFRKASANAFDLGPEKVGGTISEIIATICSRSGGLTPVVIIDSNPERSAPIDRNDGNSLAEIADACRSALIFVGIALDDEIAMADGSNSAISKSFNIEYLDPENLHKIVNAHIFPKNPRTQMLLGSLYEGFRATIPSFKWSEQRFSSLYPLHPILLELTPFIRSYLPKFALFSFASSAGERILGRPADSLIGIDDVFDSVEFDLRKLPELVNVFQAFDAAAAQINTSVPVAARHKAKLVLKVLLLNSLAQRSANGSDVSAAMMICDDGEPGNSVRDIDSMLSGYAAAFPDAIKTEASGDSGPRYRFNIGSSEYDKRANDIIDKADPALADRMLARAIASRFPELADVLSGETRSAVLYSEWRGSRRPGRLFASDHPPDNVEVDGGRFDWEVSLDLSGTGAEDRKTAFTGTRIEWKTCRLRDEEKRSLILHGALPSEDQLRVDFPDEFSASILSASNAADAAVQRMLIDDARLVIDGFDYNFSESARQAPNLCRMIGEMLEPLFETIHPEHPYFVETLTPEIVDRFVKSLSDGEGSDQGAMTFGVALGIAEFVESGFTILGKEKLRDAVHVASVMEALVSSGTEGETDLAVILARLAEPPFGLTVEAVRLILSAMAHRGVVDLITEDRERVNGRSIDLKLDWQSIAYVAVPKNLRISDEELVEWAKLVSGDESIESLAGAESRAKVIEAFMEIAAQWERRSPFETFDSVSDCDLNTKIWKHSNKTWEAFTKIVADVNEALNGDITIEEGLDRICHAFLGRPETFYQSRGSIIAIEDFARSRTEIGRINNYLALAGITFDGAVESARSELRSSLRVLEREPCDSAIRELGYRWEKFQRLYAEHYKILHDRSDAPSGFAIEKPPNGAKSFKRVRDPRKCSLDPTAFLQLTPFCKCGFQVAALKEIGVPSLTDSLPETIADDSLLGDLVGEAL